MLWPPRPKHIRDDAGWKLQSVCRAFDGEAIEARKLLHR
jgi:hypothetical protein